MTLSEMSGATFSPCGKYRHLLWRRWDTTKPILNLVMLNPSKAGATESDATVTRQIKRATLLGYGSLFVTNAFDLISTDPLVLKSHPKPLSDWNDGAIIATAQNAIESGGMVIVGWGRHCTKERRDQLLVLLMDIPLYALDTNIDGSPCHPLYIPYNAVPVRWP